ncbi:restriction endonuclease subunit S [Vibrio splendidus]
MVPNGWEKHPVGKLCKSIVPGRNKPKVFDGDIPWVTTPEISGKYIPSNNQKNFISQVVAKECGAKVVPKGAVVIAAVGELGLTAIATEEIILNQQLHAFVCPNDLDNEYLAYFLSAQKPYMDTVASKTTIPYMNKSNCESIPVLLPPLPEQRKIAKILSTWDKAIVTTEKLIETSKQQKKALMQQLLTGKKRLINPETGKVFEGEWEEVFQGDVATFHNGRAYKKTEWEEQGTPVIRLQNLTGRGKEFYYSTLKLPEHQYCTKGDLLYMWSATFGPAIWQGDKAIYHYHIWKVSCKSNQLSKSFMFYMLDFETQKWMSKSNGMGLLHITKTTMEKQLIGLPAIAEQQKIASALTAADKEIKVLKTKLAHLKQEKKALMQKLLTGKRRVKVAETEAA